MISVTDLKPGERVIMDCPEAENPILEAVFEGIFGTRSEAMLTVAEAPILVAYVDKRIPGDGQWSWARFLLASDTNETGGNSSVMALLRVNPEGVLLNSEGLPVFIRDRTVMGKG